MRDFFDKIFFGTKFWLVPIFANNYRPKLLASPFLFYFVIFLFVSKLFLSIIAINVPKTYFFADIAKSELLSLVNNQRQSLGVAPLNQNTKLDQAAMLKALDMFEKGYFDHQGPDGTLPWAWFQKAGYDYKYAGENLAIGYFESLDVYNAWLESPSHRANFLSPYFNEVGTAIVRGAFEGSDAIIVVHLFGTQKKTLSLPQVKTPMQTAKSEPIKVTPVVGTLETQTTAQKQSTVKASYDFSLSKTDLSEKSNKYLELANAFFYEYKENLEKIIFIMFIIVSLLSIVNIAVNYSIQDRRLVLRSFIMVLGLLAAMNFNDLLIISMLRLN